MLMPLCTVVIAARHGAPALATTVVSLQAQWMRDWEAIIVVDAGCDDTLTQALSLAARDARIRVVPQSGRGLAAARNLGARYARGTWIAFLDAGDAWLQCTLGVFQASFAAAPQTVAVYGQVALCDERLMPTGRRSPRPRPLTPPLLLGEDPLVCASNLAVSQQAFIQTGGFAAELEQGAERDWLFRAWAAEIGPVQGVATVLVLRRGEAADPAARLAADQATWMRLMAQAMAAAPDKVKPHYRQAQALHLYATARRALEHPTTCPAAAGLLLRAIRAAPLAMLATPGALPLLAAALIARLLPIVAICHRLRRLAGHDEAG